MENYSSQSQHIYHSALLDWIRSLSPLPNFIVVHVLCEKDKNHEKSVATQNVKSLFDPITFGRHRLIFCSTKEGWNDVCHHFKPQVLITGGTTTALVSGVSLSIPYVVVENADGSLSVPQSDEDPPNVTLGNPW